MALVKLAVRNLRRNRRRTAITLAALVVGVAAMVAIRGFILGVRTMMFDNQSRGSLGALQVHRAGYVENVLSAPLTLDMADTPELRATIAEVPGVTAVAPRIEFGAQLSTPDKRPPPEDGSELPEAERGASTFLVVTGVDPSLERLVTPKRWEWLGAGRGQMFSDASAAVVVLNDDFAKSCEAPVQAAGAPLPPLEQQLALLAPDRDGSLNGENVVVGATFVSATPNDRRVGLVPLGIAQRLLRMEGRVTEYAIATAPDVDLEALQRTLAARLGPGYEVHRWDERIPFVRDIVETQDAVFGVVTQVFLFVVLLGIVNSMLMSVLERVREIGTMLAVGMRRRSIISLFVLEGVVLGVLGGLLGLALGFAMVTVTNRLGVPIPAPGAKVASLVRPTVGPLLLLRVLVQAALGAALASLWPAWRASRLRPVEALAHT